MPSQSGDWKSLKKDIVELVREKNCAPILVRLAWHACGTYDRSTGDGGSNGATMRFSAEAGDGANNGLGIARGLLDPIKANHPWVSYADLWTFAGAVAIEATGGPVIPWQSGRTDAASEKECPPQGRLPAADKGSPENTARHVRYVFNRMGFNDEEMVALIGGGHSLGRCRTDRSGYEGPWTPAPFNFDNDYFTLLTDKKWKVREWDGPLQYEDEETGKLMMLPSDLVMLTDASFGPHTRAFAQDRDLFFSAFSAAFAKLLSLGCENLQDIAL
eukprot:CAMPEP_0113869426 /NCGR_PEP_ID=MMETSP0780_2-20120614/1531_1 /TAXON_ID=652834 /ORGANISM="Palpitomonas bilix" /LENGTH=272 /DNA_ID=CAMNT_0000854605 /DNA_START=28 /DNA_END=846 /DNA_ORIENTATION=+ /assembly_acc=CAM_ASM_000599